MADKTFALEDYLRILWQRKWLLILPVVTMVAVTAVGSVFLKDIYRAYTLILVEPQQVPEEYVKSSVTFSVEKHMNTIRQQLMSRTLLERVIAEYNLYPELVAEGVPMEEIVELMRDNIQLRVEGKDAFTLYFQGPDPYLVMQVTNKIGSLFIESTSESRERQASDTVTFLESSRDELKVQLEEAEDKIQKFKAIHIGALPEQTQSNLQTIDRLQAQLQTSSDLLRDAQNRRAQLASQLANLRQKSMISQGGSSGMVDYEMRLQQLQAELAALQLKYTNEHPDVIRKKGQIDSLKGKMRSDSGSGQQVDNPMTRQIEASLAAAEADTRRLQAEVGGLHGQINKYQGKVEMTPKVEQELSMLTRDYETTRASYEDVLSKLTEAKRSSEMETKNKGQQFKVIDAAKQPGKPFKPNRPYIVAIGFALGLLIGMTAVFLAEHFDDSFKNAEDIEDALGVSVLSSIPRIETQAEIDQRNRQMQLGIVVACLIAAGAVVLIIIKMTFLTG
ncbi:GumC family protein [bacterium]|nr:GumC family protein [bacterium]